MPETADEDVIVEDAGANEDSPGPQITNAKFLAAIFQGELPEGTFAAVCTKPGDPDKGGWTAHRFDARTPPLLIPDRNNYLGCSSFYPEMTARSGH
jgi:hypothetical protein